MKKRGRLLKGTVRLVRDDSCPREFHPVVFLDGVRGRVKFWMESCFKHGVRCKQSFDFFIDRA